MKKSAALVTIAAAILAVGLTAALVQNPVQTYLPSAWRFQPQGSTYKTGDLLAGGETSPNRKWISFVSVGQGTHHLYIVNAQTGAVASTASLPVGWIGMAWNQNSTELSVSGGTLHAILHFDINIQGIAKQKERTAIPDFANNTGWFSGLVRLDETFYINSAASDKLVKIDSTGKVIATLQFEKTASPYQLRSHQGKLYASLQGSDRIAEIDPETLTESRSFPTGDHPNDIAIRGERLFVACGNEDTIEIYDLYSGLREERLNVRPWFDAPPGSTPHSLAVSPAGDRLYAAISDNNAVAVIDIKDRGRSQIQGYIPTALYPTAVACLADGTLLAGSGKGFGTGPNGNTEKIDPIAPQGYPYIVTLRNGVLQKTPRLEGKALEQATKAVLDLAKYKPGNNLNPSKAPKPGSNPIPSKVGDPSPIKHVLYIIKENRTYDQLFGDLKKDGKPYGNGDPKLTLFGQDIAPNHRKLAMDYVLLDNFYASGDVSVDGHHWSKAAYVPDFMQRTWPQQYSGKGAPRLPENLSMPPSGFIWDAVRRAGKSYRTYYYHTNDRANAEWAAARRGGARDYQYVDIFINEFKKFEREGTMPNFMVMALSEDHTSGTRPGAATPQAAVASNDYGLGKVVEAISKSSLWSKFAIFVVEDDAQNGPDHVDAHRTISLLISPYTRNRGLDSTHYTTTSVIRTIGLILGTQPLSQFDAAATPFYNAFHNKPDLTPYSHLVPNTDLNAKNPPRPTDPGVDAIDFSEPDQLDVFQEQALNRDIWYAIKPNETFPGITRRFGSPKPRAEEEEEEGDD
jgi:DNA-binding beta-propeller fold protein YncE